jgi:hypothetical protein
MFRQNLAAEWIDLAERHGLKPARALQAKREPANAGKQIKDAKLRHAATLRSAPMSVSTALA